MHKKQIGMLTILSLVVLIGCTNTVTPEPEPENNSTSQINGMTDSTQADNFAKLDMYSEAPEAASSEELKGKVATISTDLGDIKIEFFEESAPQTVTNFIFLANEGFYDNLVFHRRVEGFVLQGGDPIGTDPVRKGSGGPGYTVPAEIKEKHLRGSVATARTADQVNPLKASSGSQFYIALEDLPMLDGEYTVFGRVIEGMDIVDKLQEQSVMNKVTIE